MVGGCSVFTTLNSSSRNAISDLLSSLKHLSVHLMKIKANLV